MGAIYTSETLAFKTYRWEIKRKRRKEKIYINKKFWEELIAYFP
jgi:hypothetical protein